MNKRIILIILSLVFTGLQAMQNEPNSIPPLSVTERVRMAFTHYVAKPIVKRIDDPARYINASLETQKQWEKAQEELGIPRDYWIPAKKSIRVSSLAGVWSSLMYINEEAIERSIKRGDHRFTQGTNGPALRRFILRHEAAHVRHSDWQTTYLAREAAAAAPFLLGAATASTAGFGGYNEYRLSGGYNMPRGRFYRHTLIGALFLEGVAGIGLWLSDNGKYFVKRISKAHEERADRTAATMIQCSDCLGDIADWRQNMRSNIKGGATHSRGYLTHDELKRLAHLQEDRELIKTNGDKDLDHQSIYETHLTCADAAHQDYATAKEIEKGQALAAHFRSQKVPAQVTSQELFAETEDDKNISVNATFIIDQT